MSSVGDPPDYIRSSVTTRMVLREGVEHWEAWSRVRGIGPVGRGGATEVEALTALSSALVALAESTQEKLSREQSLVDEAKSFCDRWAKRKRGADE